MREALRIVPRGSGGAERARGGDDTAHGGLSH